MRTILIALLILFPVSTNAGQSHDWDIQGKMKEFERLLEGNEPHKCTERNFSYMLNLSYQIYTGVRFLDALERLNVQNQIYPVKWQGDQVALAHLKERLDEDAQISYRDVVDALNLWYHRNCVKSHRTDKITVRWLTSVEEKENGKTNKH